MCCPNYLYQTHYKNLCKVEELYLWVISFSYHMCMSNKSKWQNTSFRSCFLALLTLCCPPATSRVRVQQQSRNCGIPVACVEDRWPGGAQDRGCRGSWGDQRGHSRGTETLDPVPSSDTGLQLHRTWTMEQHCRCTHHRIWYVHIPHSLPFPVCKCPKLLSGQYCISSV